RMPGTYGIRAALPRLSQHRCGSANGHGCSQDCRSAPGKTDLPDWDGLRAGREVAVLWLDLPKTCVNLNDLSYWSPFTCKLFATRATVRSSRLCFCWIQKTTDLVVGVGRIS